MHWEKKAGKWGVLSLLLFCLIVTGFTCTASAGELVGAEGVISGIDKILSAEKEKNKSGEDEAVEKLQKDVENFKLSRSSMKPGKAVSRWLELYDRFWNLPPAATQKMMRFGRRGGAEFGLEALLSAVPPPDTWKRLKKQVLDRQKSKKGLQEAGLRLMVYYLTGDRENLKKSLEAFKTDALLGRQEATYLLDSLKVDDFLEDDGKKTKSIVEKFNTYLDDFATERPSGTITVQMPDLLALSDKKKATELIVKALGIPGLRLNVPSGGETLALAKSLIKAHADKLIEPHWNLVTEPGDWELYEIMVKRFPEKKKDEKGSDIFLNTPGYRRSYGTHADDRRLAKIKYLLGLISENRIKEATTLADDMTATDFTGRNFKATWQSFEKMRYADELIEFCKATLKKHPELPLWNQCGVIASAGKKGGDLLRVITELAEREALNPDSRLGILERKVDLLLAMDEVDKATALLRKLVNYKADKASPQTKFAMASVKIGLASRMIVLGDLLERPKLMKEGEEKFNKLKAEFDQPMGNIDYRGFKKSPLKKLVDSRLKKKDYAGAEKIIIQAMESAVKESSKSGMSVTMRLLRGGGPIRELLIELATIYDKAGRHDEVLALLEKAPWWGVSDLINIVDEQRSLTPIVARALRTAGREKEAVEILKNHLYGYPEDDDVYMELVTVPEPSLKDWLDKLHLRDRFEERPLIWKAVILMEEGNLDEAEETVRRALKIDPTDGKQKGENRVRGYAVLGEILKLKGNKKDAAFFKGVVEAVRIAQKGDKFADAGLLKRSLKLYEEASDLFADAYCIQWRMAEKLSAMGDIKGARKHYEIAFRRMPEQFGRVASVCFGCQGVFTHQESRSAAERILTELSQTSPEKPQVHFLLGELRTAQGRKIEAFRHFKMAAELDHDYLDAWKKAYKLSSEAFVSKAEMEDIVLNMVKLDPMNRHTSLYQIDTHDLKSVWEIYEKNFDPAFKIPEKLLELKASKEKMKGFIKELGEEMAYYMSDRTQYRRRRAIPEPGHAVARNSFIQSLMRFVMNSGGGMMH